MIHLLRQKNYLLKIILVLTITLPSAASHGVPSLTVNDYSKEVDFRNKEVVLFQRGDNAEFSKNNFDDSEWRKVSLPYNWNTIYPKHVGICWYRIHIVFPAVLPYQSIGIRLGTIIDADEVYLNGTLIGKSGKFPPQREHSYDQVRIYEIPSSLIKPGKENILAIKVIGFFKSANGLYKGKYLIGPFNALQKDLYLSEMINIIFIVIYITIVIYMGLFFLRFPAAKENLVFSLFTLFAASYFFLRTQTKYLLTKDFFLLKKIEYAVLVTLFIFLLEFVTIFFNKRRNIFHYFFYGMTILYVIFIIFTGNIIIMDNILRNLVHPSWVFPIGYCLYILIKHIRKEQDAKYLMAAFLVLLATVANDIMVSRVMYDFIRLSNYGFLILIFSIIIITNNHFVMMKDEVDRLTSKKEGSRSISITSEIRDKLEMAISIVKEDYASELTRKIIADRIEITPDYLGKIFKRYTGKRFSAFLNEYRIEKAKELLRQSNASVTNIAYSVGFESLPTFYRIFQRVTGESPKSYKKGHPAKTSPE